MNLKNVKAWILIKCVRPFAAMVITLLVIFTGGLGSIYSPEIRNSFPFYLGQGEWSWEAAMFWLFAVITSSGYFLREWAVEKKQFQLHEKMVERAREFEVLIRTMPPKNFLATFSTLFNAADAISSVYSSSSDEEKLQGIRHVLKIIGTLAQVFDAADIQTRYAANIMMFLPTNSLSEEECEKVKSHLKFCDKSTSPKHLRGVLMLNPRLSTIAGDDKAQCDPELSIFALAIPKIFKGSTGYKVMPGAPIAFVDRVPDYYSDTSKMADWCRHFGDFPKDMIEEVHSFFAQSTIKGFLSIPLFPTRENGADDDRVNPVAILNVHCDVSNLLVQAEALAHFVNIMRPFQVILIKMLMPFLDELSLARILNPSTRK